MNLQLVNFVPDPPVREITYWPAFMVFAHGAESVGMTVSDERGSERTNIRSADRAAVHADLDRWLDEAGY